MSITNLFDDADEQKRSLSRREERRADHAADAARQRDDERLAREQIREDRRLAAEQRRADDDAKLQRRLTEKAAADRARVKADKDKAEERARAKTARAAARKAAVAAVSEHVPLFGLPVVVVGLGMGWSGQAGAALAAGMGLWSYGVPVLFEGLVLTFGALASTAIGRPGSPYKFLVGVTIGAGLLAAGVNAGGHLIEDCSPAGVYRAAGFAFASLVVLILWLVAMLGKKQSRTGAQAVEIARRRRLKRRHPIVAHRARRIADLTGAEFPDAFALAWERTNGADVKEPLIVEIRDTKRSLYRRAVAQAWDGRKGRDKPLVEEVASPVSVASEPVPVALPESGPTTGAGASLLWVAPSYGKRSRGTPDPLPEEAVQDAEIPFPTGKRAHRAKAAVRRLKLSERQLRKAAKVWHERLVQVQTDRRYYSPTGHLGVSPYAVAAALKMRTESGPAIVRALIDAQLVPAE